MFREKPTLVRELRSIGVSMGVRVVSGRNGKSCKSNVRGGKKAGGTCHILMTQKKG